MKKYLGMAFAILGLLIIMFPTFVKLYSKTQQTKVIINYSKSEETKEQEKLKEEKEEYNKKLLEENKFLTQTLLGDFNTGTSYFNATDLGDMISVVTIPKINVILPVYEGTTAEILQFGVGHIESSSYPIGGKGTHCILTGHTGLSTSKLFDDITELEIGDKFYLDTNGEKLIYEVDQIQIVLPEETNKIELNENEDYCTLVTCYPIYVNSHRLLVRGKRVENVSEVEVDDYDLITLANQKNEQSKIKLYLWVGLFVFIVIVIIAIFIIAQVIANKKKKRVKRYVVVKKQEEEDDF